MIQEKEFFWLGYFFLMGKDKCIVSSNEKFKITQLKESDFQFRVILLRKPYIMHLILTDP